MEDKMRGHRIIKKGLGVAGLAFAVWSCYASEYHGPVAVIHSPHSFMGAQMESGSRSYILPASPSKARRLGKFEPEMKLKSLSEEVWEYTGNLTEQALGEIKKKLDENPFKYIIKHDIGGEERDAIFDWYDVQGQKDLNIYRFIWMDYKSTSHALEYGAGLLPPECIETHVLYYQAVNPLLK